MPAVWPGAPHPVGVLLRLGRSAPPFPVTFGATGMLCIRSRARLSASRVLGPPFLRAAGRSALFRGAGLASDVGRWWNGHSSVLSIFLFRRELWCSSGGAAAPKNGAAIVACGRSRCRWGLCPDYVGVAAGDLRRSSAPVLAGVRGRSRVHP